jgi:NodT family efflux transporter outer membrane factor (OMF) lipoprotein
MTSFRPRGVRLLATLGALTISGCTVGPDYQPPVFAVSETWIGPVKPGAVDADWWRTFDDPILSDLVDRAIAGNKDLAEAEARLREVRALRDAVRGRALPQADATAAATENRLSENGQLPVGKVPGLGRDLSIFDAGFDASWEIDLWGRNRRAIESAEARADAAEELRRGTVIQIIAEVVRTYIDLRAAQALHANAAADAAAQENIARLVADRLRAGLASQSDLNRADTLAHTTAASVPQFRTEADAAAFRLALLVGEPPEALYDSLRAPLPLPSVRREVSAGLRSELLRRRPDIRHAERELAAATADIGLATAELFPRFSLLGGIGFQARDIGDVFSGDSLRFQVGPALHWPLFSGGRIRAGIKAADARADAALARYERTVLTALGDSETAINRFAAAGEVRTERQIASASAAQAVELAGRRYRAGEEDLTALLQVELAQHAADRADIEAQAAELRQLAALYKALGGGWENLSGSVDR